MAQLLNQFHHQPVISTNSYNLLNDTNQLLLNRSARYVQLDMSQLSSIENFEKSIGDDFLKYQDLIYNNAGNEYVNYVN